ncbi:MAG: RnfABCDGE type electron transport complex subunit D [Erysipelotrichales bacterium]
MKFKYSISPSVHASVDTKQMMRDVLIALLFVSICSLVLQHSLYGIDGVIRGLIIMIIAVVTCYLVDFVYFKLLKTKKEDVKVLVNQNVPAITGLILALTLPLGNLDSYAMFYVTFVSALVAELFGKVIYGGFGYNIFNPAAVGRAFALLGFGKYLVIPTIDGLASSSPLQAMHGSDGILAGVNETFTNYSSLLFGAHQGAIGETIIIPLIIAAIFLIWRRVIDWIIPITSLLTIAILAFVFGSLNGLGLEYVLLHLMSGGLFFGVVFMLTDPVTNPLNRQGKMIYAIIFALITFLIRAKASLPEGVVFSILIVNMLVPMIDKLTANVTDVGTNKKVISVVATLVIAILVTVLFKFV